MKNSNYIKALLPAFCLLSGATGLRAQSVILEGKDGVKHTFLAGQVDSVVVRPARLVEGTTTGELVEKSNIYETLRNFDGRNFFTMLHLIDDLGKTASLRDDAAAQVTLVAADDAAFAAFFSHCPWTDAEGNPVQSYEQLTMAQKRLLLGSMMLEGALPLRNLAVGGSVKNALQRPTMAATTDSIPFWRFEDLPQDPSSGTSGSDVWTLLKEQSPDGIYMLLGPAPSLTNILRKNMSLNGVTPEDVAFVLNRPTADGEEAVYLNGAKVVEGNVACTNGYCHVVESVLLPPINMAEAVRTNSRTRLFSAMLDRFSQPVKVTDEELLSALPEGVTSLYVKQYEGLNYNPGNLSAAAVATDMKAMFVANDEAVTEYFVRGAGQKMINSYATKPNTEENLLYNLYQIPTDILAEFLKNYIKDSFLGTVPGKWQYVLDAYGNTMLDSYATLDEFKATVSEVMVAGDGVVYVLNRLPQPPRDAMVVGPVMRSAQAKVVNAVMRADENYMLGSSYYNAPFKRYYSTLLQGAQNRFSFFVPTDEGLETYGLVDPMSLARSKSSSSYYRYWLMSYSNKNKAILPVQADAYRYDEVTGQNPTDRYRPSGTITLNTSAPGQSLTSGTGLIKKFLLMDMMDQHIIVHHPDDTVGINGARQYWTSRGGAPVIVKAKNDVAGVGMKVNGGWQWQVNRDSYPDNDHDCTVTESQECSNGNTYFLDRPMQPVMQSVANVLSHDDAHYAEFFKLCQISFYEDLLQSAGFKTETMDDATWGAVVKRYCIFTYDSGYNAAQGDAGLVSFFNNFRYTVYVPTNEAVAQAISLGLPTPEGIETFITKNAGSNGELSEENKLKAQAMITMLINFLRYHFQDQTLYVDNVTESGVYQTACFGTPRSLRVEQMPGVLTVTDGCGQRQNVVAPVNVLARDANFDKSVSSTATSIKNSSYVVLHQVNKVLNFMELPNGRYDDFWSTAAKAQKFLEEFSVK